MTLPRPPQPAAVTQTLGQQLSQLAIHCVCVCMCVYVCRLSESETESSSTSEEERERRRKKKEKKKQRRSSDGSSKHKYCLWTHSLSHTLLHSLALHSHCTVWCVQV